MPSSVRSAKSPSRPTPRSSTKSPVQKDPMEEFYKDPKKYQDYYNELYDSLQTEKANFDECSFVFLNTKRPLEPIITLQTTSEELFYGSFDGPIRCFSTSNGKRTQTLRGHSSLVSGLELVSRDKVANELDMGPMEDLSENTEEGKEVFKSRNDYVLFSSSRDGDVRCWDLNLSKTIKRLTTETAAPMTCMKVCLKENCPTLVATGGLDGNVTLWNLAKGSISAIYTGHASAISSLEYSDNKLFSASLDSFVKIVDIEKEEVFSIIRPNSHPVRSISVIGNEIFVGTSTGVIQQYDLRTSALVGCFRGHTDCVLCTKVYDPNYLLSGSEDSFVVLWDIKTKEMVHVYGGHKDSVTAISITDQDKSVYSGSLDKTIRRWAASSAIGLVQKESLLMEHKKKLEELLAKEKKKQAK
ncbi:hypothetical protein C9374_003369 [Naegleria lovaniensis]|uniref:Guanine nucleotide-binding protein subunit beta-like protein n=1 Tax=Naegleria lovaniensis TaxID=51637 RepID=A0AA88KL77_NAELO|nr:uncharacterized protein C9374_003369 [Naegleria lovaniensis]KAG2385554.1 hypothetical protein C9374_003369 [Naegleria lovaniensis]